jgi:signal transduction histidine kinase
MKETERLAQMVEELLDFSRMQTGHFSLERTKLDILAELGDAVVTYEQKAAKEGIELIYKEPEYLPLIEGDKNRIHQVFINVIDNAIKYSDKGDTVQIDATERNGNIVITVNDMGCGIKAADLPRVKEKFFKANHTRRGSGIGLAVANEIVEGHGGNISITSKENVGTTVTISLPYIKQENNQLR